MITIGSYSQNGSNANTTKITQGGLTLYYSYDTVIAFTVNGVLTMRENDWSTTTGKHMNWLDPDKKMRITGEKFEKRLKKAYRKNITNIHNSTD